MIVFKKSPVRLGLRLVLVAESIQYRHLKIIQQNKRIGKKYPQKYTKNDLLQGKSPTRPHTHPVNFPPTICPWKIGPRENCPGRIATDILPGKLTTENCPWKISHGKLSRYIFLFLECGMVVNCHRAGPARNGPSLSLSKFKVQEGTKNISAITIKSGGKRKVSLLG